MEVRKTVLVVDDEPAMLRLLREGLPPHLYGFDVETARNGTEAVAVLESRPVDVLVTDVNMPGMDGFELLAHASRHFPNLPVVVLSVMAPEDVEEGLVTTGTIRVLRKPASASVIAQAVKDARAQTARGRLSQVPLATLLHLMRLERKTCSLLVRSGDRKGRLHFLSGELVNAYAFELDIDGEEAARHLLAWDTVNVEFERSLHNHHRRIDTPLEQLLLEVATTQDHRAHDRSREPTEAPAPTVTQAPVVRPVDRLSLPAAETEAPEPPILVRDSTPASLAQATDHLARALSHLRTRATDTQRAIDDVAPLVDTAGVALARSRTTIGIGPTEGDSWRDLADLAYRLAKTAERFATDPGSAD
jgi:CheY-like chemotaxis protein